MNPQSELELKRTKVRVTNLEKVFYPRTGFTKGDMIDYYIRISPWLLPHLKDRPITLKRYPDGVEGLFFYQKECPGGRPKKMTTTKVPRSDGSQVSYCVINRLGDLVWAVNLGDLELHTFLHKAKAIQMPTCVAFDLDPGPPADILTCCKVSLELLAMLDSLELKAFLKTSGSKGLQAYVPLNSSATYQETKTFARALAEALAERFPDMIVSKMQKQLRKGKVFIDWSQNDDHKTTVTAYSLRAQNRPTVSTPVTREEIEGALKAKKQGRLVFDSDQVLQRVEKDGDLFGPVLSMKQHLPSVKSLEQ